MAATLYALTAGHPPPLPGKRAKVAGDVGAPGAARPAGRGHTGSPGADDGHSAGRAWPLIRRGGPCRRRPRCGTSSRRAGLGGGGAGRVPSREVAGAGARRRRPRPVVPVPGCPSTGGSRPPQPGRVASVIRRPGPGREPRPGRPPGSAGGFPDYGRGRRARRGCPGRAGGVPSPVLAAVGGGLAVAVAAALLVVPRLLSARRRPGRARGHAHGVPARGGSACSGVATDD